MDSQVQMGLRMLPSGAAMSIDGRGGLLTVVAGRLWLTRGRGDEILGPGQFVRLSAGAVVEPWDYGTSAAFRWHPAPAWPQRLAALVLRGLAALARSAAAMASRAQGCIASGDSIASSGAVK